MTPLHIASSKGYLKAVEFLIEHQANYSIKNHNGLTPYDLAQKKGMANIVGYFKNRVLVV